MVFESLKFYTVNEVASSLRVSEDFIMELFCEGILEGIDLGGKGIWIIEERAIIDFLCKCSNVIGKGNGLSLIKDDKVVVSNSFDVVKGKQVVFDDLDNRKIISDFSDSDLSVLKSGFRKCGEEASVVSNGMGDVVTEFIFDEEQARKPISDELVFLSDGDDECVSEGEDKGKSLLKTRGEGLLSSAGDKQSVDNGKKSVSSTVYGRVKRNFVISEFLIEKLQKVRDILGESMSSIVECALKLYFHSKGFLVEHNF